MQSKLTKAWGPYVVGTVVADNSTEARDKPGAIHVNPDRFAKLHESGFFAPNERSSPPSQSIPAEVQTATPREPVGQSGKTPPAEEP